MVFFHLCVYIYVERLPWPSPSLRTQGSPLHCPLSPAGDTNNCSLAADFEHTSCSCCVNLFRWRFPGVPGGPDRGACTSRAGRDAASHPPRCRRRLSLPSPPLPSLNPAYV